MQFSKVTYALAAAGIGAALATGYMKFDGAPFTDARAAVTAPVAVAPTAASRLPDFTVLAEKAGGSVVNISVIGKTKVTGFDPNDIDPDSPFGEFFKRFGGKNGIPQMPKSVPSQGLGSGFIVSADGYIITNAHVVDGASEVTVKLTDRREFTAKVIGADPRTDIALIKIDAKNLPALDMSAPPGVKQGEWVVAIGSPFGFENSISAGIVSGVHRALPGGQMTPFIQTDVAVNPGNSGGPLLDRCGAVIGINTLFSEDARNIGFAIPIDAVKVALKSLKDSGRVVRPWLGLQGRTLDPSLANVVRMPVTAGFLVEVVEDGSPAERAGLRGGRLSISVQGEDYLLGGDIVTAVNGSPVRTREDFGARVKILKVGQRARLTVFRDGTARDVTVNVAERPRLPYDLSDQE